MYVNQRLGYGLVRMHCGRTTKTLAFLAAFGLGVFGSGRQAIFFQSKCRAADDAASKGGLAATAMFPKADAKDVCPDTPLKITFAAAPVAGNGKIEIYDAANDKLVETIDVATPTKIKNIGGFPNWKYYPILITDKEAAIYFANEALDYGKTYYVKIDAGAFKGKDEGDKASSAISDAKAWKFTTKAAPPAAGNKKIIVAADGTGDFATVQGALDWIPEGNSEPMTVFIRNGTYNEIVALAGKNNITIVGEDRKKTIIAYANNNNFNNNAGFNPFANGANPTNSPPIEGAGSKNPNTPPLRRGNIYHRGMFLAHRVDDLKILNLTLHNTTPQGGSQMEAIILNGTKDAHAILANVDLYAYQDTLQINGQAYITNCHIEGDVDFMWGTGPCFFENCECKTLRNNAYYTQIRNPVGNHGYVYKNCTFSGAPGITGNSLSRIAPMVFPYSEVVLIDCVLTDAVGPAGWKLDRSTDAPNVHFWEYNSRDPAGQPIDTSKRLEISKQLKLPEDKETIDNYSDAKWVLGGKWTPEVPRIDTK